MLTHDHMVCIMDVRIVSEYIYYSKKLCGLEYINKCNVIHFGNLIA